MPNLRLNANSSDQVRPVYLYLYILYDILTLIPYLVTEDTEKRKMRREPRRDQEGWSVSERRTNWDLWFSADRTTTIILSLPLLFF